VCCVFPRRAVAARVRAESITFERVRLCWWVGRCVRVSVFVCICVCVRVCACVSIRVLSLCLSFSLEYDCLYTPVSPHTHTPIPAPSLALMHTRAFERRRIRCCSAREVEAIFTSRIRRLAKSPFSISGVTDIRKNECQNIHWTFVFFAFV